MRTATGWSIGPGLCWPALVPPCWSTASQTRSVGFGVALEGAGLARGRMSVPTLDQCFNLDYQDGRWTTVPGATKAERLTASEASSPRDWHNDYAQTLLDLRAALTNAPDDRSRRRLLQELRRVLSVHGR
jgi:metallo-beta-lactamase family protein